MKSDPMLSSLLYQEISEQPAVLQRLFQEEKNNVQKIVEQIKGSFNYVLIAARGTSDHAALYAQYLFQIHNQIPVALATPSVFTGYQAAPRLDGALVIGISQSGQSPDIVSVVAEAKKQHRPTLVITNSPSSPLAQQADHVIPLHAGPEKAVAATKSYTTSLLAMAMISESLNPSEERKKALEELPEKVKQTLNRTLSLIPHMQRYRYMQHCAIISRGFNYCTAYEIALKIKELTGINTLPYSSADFQHGPIAIIHREYPVLFITHQGEVHKDILSLMEKVRALGAELMVISDDPQAIEKADFPILIPSGIPEWLSPITNIIPGQILGLRLAIEKDRDPDQPAGLKKVTETY